jgi:DNA polymerase-1
MSALLQENRLTRMGYFRFSLEALALAYLPDGERKIHPIGIAPEDFGTVHACKLAERGISDAFLTYRIYETLMPQIVAESLETVLELEDRIILAVVNMERNGFKLDRAKLERWNAELPGRIDTLRKKLKEDTGLLVNPRGPKSVTAVFEKFDIPIPQKYDEEKLVWKNTFDVEHMHAVDHPVARDILAMRKLESMQSKYVTKYLEALDDDNKIHYQLHQLGTDGGESDSYGTVTGRFSSGGGPFRINVQQVAKGEKQAKEFAYLGLPDDYLIRSLFLPEFGNIMGASDAAQIEFRIFAHYSRNEQLLEAYRKNPRIDFHLLVTQMMNPWVTDPKELAKLRSDMKQNNFGVLYGMGRAKLAVRLGLGCTCGYDWAEVDEEGFRVRQFHANSDHKNGCPAMQANLIMENYHEEFPDAKALLKKASSIAERKGYVLTYLGRRRRYPTRFKIHSALNAVVQGGAADYFKTKLAVLWENRRGLGITLHAPVHDEFVYSAGDVESVTKAHRLLQRQEWADLRVPLLWDTGYGPDWLQANTKE